VLPRTVGVVKTTTDPDPAGFVTDMERIVLATTTPKPKARTPPDGAVVGEEAGLESV